MSFADQLQETVDHGFKRYLDKHGGELSPDRYIEHRNYLKVAVPLVKSLKMFRRHRLNDSTRFTAEEQDLVSRAIDQLDASLVPITLIKRST